MRRWAWLLFLFVTLGCRRDAAAQKPPPLAPGTRTAAAPKAAVTVFDGAFTEGWQDYGWAERAKRSGPGPERLDFSGHAGWILASNPRLSTTAFGGLSFRVRAPAAFGDFLQVRLDSEVADVFPRVKVEPRHRRALADGWAEVFVPMRELNPAFAPFDKVVLRAWADVPKGWVEVDGVALTAPDDATRAAAEKASKAPGRAVTFTVDCRGPTKAISPLIYGVAFSPMSEFKADTQWKLGATARRWGGNPASRYNWALGNAWNTAADWYFRNVNYTDRADYTWKHFFDANAARGVQTALTVPMLGWVAKDTTSFSFSSDDYGPMASMDPDVPKAGDGRSPAGKALPSPPPVTTSVASTPEAIGAWLKAVGQSGHRADMVILDNEPMLWNDTHRDVHPEAVTYDELLEKTVRYGAAVRKAAPKALIAGPALWGWPAYFHSAKDAEVGLRLRPDRRAHGDEPLITWYLKQLAKYEKQTGVKLLDVVDVHFYPQGKGIGLGTEGATDAATSALRIRSTRALWDPTYKDESWIDDTIMLIPRMREWVRTSYPGLELSLGEYNFGAERHMSGGLALAEALGRFGQEGLYSAFYWTYPPEKSPAYWAFRAYRDYDGAGARFQDLGLRTTAPKDASAFASRDKASTTLTVVLLNLSPAEALDGTLSLKGCPAVAGQRAFSYTGGAAGLEAAESQPGKPLRLAPWSINVVELSLGKRGK